MTEPVANVDHAREEKEDNDENDPSSSSSSREGTPTAAEEAPAPEVLVKEEEMKLKKKFPTAVRPGGSLFLQKKLLQRDKKYFDSGDYNMARGQAAKGPQPKLKGQTITGARLVVPDEPTGDSHPVPELIPQRKVSISHASKLVSPVGRETTTPGDAAGDPMQHPLVRLPVADPTLH